MATSNTDQLREAIYSCSFEVKTYPDDFVLKINQEGTDELIALIEQHTATAVRAKVQELRDKQAEFVKAQSGHVKNNNNWPRIRGSGVTARNTLDWLDRELDALKKEGSDGRI